MIINAFTKNTTQPLDQRTKDISPDAVVVSTIGMIVVCMSFFVSLSITVCLFILSDKWFRYISLGTSLLLVLAASLPSIYKKRMYKCVMGFLLFSLGITQIILIVLNPQTNSIKVFVLVIASITTAILSALTTILFPPYIPPGMNTYRSSHTRNKPSWSSSFRSTRRQSIIDFTGYDSVASTPTTAKLTPVDEGGRTEGKTNPFWVQALYDFGGANRNELSFKKGERLLVTDYRGNWWRARKENVSETGNVFDSHPNIGNHIQSGFIPSNFIQVLRKARVMPIASQKTKGSRRRHSLDGMDNTPYLHVLPGQIVEVMDSTPISTTILDSSDDHIDGALEEIECWIVRGVDARVGRVPKTWLEILGEHHEGTAKVDATGDNHEEFKDALEK